MTRFIFTRICERFVLKISKIGKQIIINKKIKDNANSDIIPQIYNYV